MNGRRHYSLYPFGDGAACGAEQEFQTTELQLVTCRDCVRIVIQHEIEGQQIGKPA